MMLKINYLFRNKKADMPFWLVMMIVSLIFATILILFLSGGINRIKQSFTNIEIKVTGQSTCIPGSGDADNDNDGWKDRGDYQDGSVKIPCDKYPTDSGKH